MLGRQWPLTRPRLTPVGTVTPYSVSPHRRATGGSPSKRGTRTRGSGLALPPCPPRGRQVHPLLAQSRESVLTSPPTHAPGRRSPVDSGLFPSILVRSWHHTRPAAALAHTTPIRPPPSAHGQPTKLSVPRRSVPCHVIGRRHAIERTPLDGRQQHTFMAVCRRAMLRRRLAAARSRAAWRCSRPQRRSA